MKRLAILVSVLSAPLVPLSGHAGEETPDAGKVLEDFISDADGTGTLLLVGRDGKSASYAGGWKNREKKTPATPGDLFEIGSASKMFTAIAVLQLVEQGKLSLSTTMDTLFPDGRYKALANYRGGNHWGEITVEMLLNHTSGMIDYLNVYGDDEKAMKLLAIKGKTYAPADLIQLAIDHGDANFKPGAEFKYCNTGYILLGEIISAKSGMNWRDFIEKNIFRPAGMADTWFGSRIPESAAKRKMSPQYNRKPSFMPPTLAGAAGEIVTNLEDFRKFLLAWQSGKLFGKPETLRMQRTRGFHEMPRTGGRLSYGYGVQKISGFYGHGGQTFGFQTFAAMNPETKRLCVVSVNDASVPAMDLFMKAEGIRR